MKTSELTGVALDWAVAKAEDVDNYILETAFYRAWCDGRYNFSGSWAHGGPIIEREKMQIGFFSEWVADPDGAFEHDGETPLIAAMRCYVASKLGDDVELPDVI